MQTATDYLVFISSQIPMLLAMTVGLVLAVIHWRRHPVPCQFLFFGCAVLLLAALLQPAGNALLMQRDSQVAMATRNTLMRNVSVVFSVLRAIGFGLVIAAVFVRRDAPPTPPLPMAR